MLRCYEPGERVTGIHILGSLDPEERDSSIHTMARRDSAVGVNDMSDGNWQPIETAPKDGREVLLRVERRAGIPGKCLVGHYMGGGHCIEGHPPIDAGWYFWNGCMFDNLAKPIEWMPLPE